MNKDYVYKMLLLIAVFFIAGMMFAQNAKADSVSYLYRLGALGYYGSDAKWLTMGEWICNNGWRGDGNLRYAIVATTGANIYSAEAQEIINVARDELCPGYVA